MATPTCIVCNASNAKFCLLYHLILYYSPEYQKPDWPLQKIISKTFTALPPRPLPSHKLAILFLVNSKDPELLWIKYERQVDNKDRVIWERPNTK
jgi:hypothetical protein